MYRSEKSPEKRSRKEFSDDDNYNKSGYKWGLRRYEDDHTSSNKDSKSYSPFKKKYSEKDYRSNKYDDHHSQLSSSYDRKKDKDSHHDDDDKREMSRKSRKQEDEAPKTSRHYRSKSPKSPIKDYRSKDIISDHRHKDTPPDYRNKDLSTLLYRKEYLHKVEYSVKSEARPVSYVTTTDRYARKYAPYERRYSPRYYESTSRDRLRTFRPVKYSNPPLTLPPRSGQRSKLSPSYLKAITSKPESLFKSVSPKFKSRPYLGNSRYFNIKYRHKNDAPSSATGDDAGKKSDANKNDSNDFKGGKKEKSGGNEDDDEEEDGATEQQLVNRKKFLVDRLAEYERNKHSMTDDDERDNFDTYSSKKMKTRMMSEETTPPKSEEKKKVDNEEQKSQIDQEIRNEEFEKDDKRDEEEEEEEEDNDNEEVQKDHSRSPSPFFEGNGYNLNFPAPTSGKNASSSSGKGISSVKVSTAPNQLTSNISSSATNDKTSTSQKNKMISRELDSRMRDNVNEENGEGGNDNKTHDDGGIDDDDIYPPLKYPGYVVIPYSKDKYNFSPLFRRSAFASFKDSSEDGGGRSSNKVELNRKDIESLKYTIVNDNRDGQSVNSGEQDQSSNLNQRFADTGELMEVKKEPLEPSYQKSTKQHQDLNEFDLRHRIHDRRHKRGSIDNKVHSESKEQTKVAGNIDVLDIHNIDNSKNPMRRVVESKDSHSLVTTISNVPIESKRSVVITNKNT